MLRSINPLLSGELLKIMDQMGHGDVLGLVDRNFPAFRYRQPVISLRGIGTEAAIDAILSAFPLDSYVTDSIRRMEIDAEPDSVNQPTQAVIAAAKRWESFPVPVIGVERFAFYEQAAAATAFVQTGETVGYACYLLRKGVIPAASR